MIYNAAFELIWPKRRRPQWRTWRHVNVQVRDGGLQAALNGTGEVREAGVHCVNWAKRYRS
jgi:hypothetical protein